MPEAAVGVLLLLAVGVAAARAVLDGMRSGTAASIAVLAPAAEAARLLRTRAVGATEGPLPGMGAGLLLLAPIVRVAAPPTWSIGVDLLWWIGAGLLLRPRSALRFVLTALLIELPMAVAVAVPLVAATPGPPPAVEAPVALVIVLAVGGLLLPWTVAGRASRLGGLPRLLAAAALASQPVAVAVVAARLLLRTDPGWTLVATIVLTGVLVVVARRFPILPPGRLAVLSVVLLLPLAVVQLGVVVALTVLSR